jgi:hypothetical protein
VAVDVERGVSEKVEIIFPYINSEVMGVDERSMKVWLSAFGSGDLSSQFVLCRQSCLCFFFAASSLPDRRWNIL